MKRCKEALLCYKSRRLDYYRDERIHLFVYAYLHFIECYMKQVYKRKKYASCSVVGSENGAEKSKYYLSIPF